jgi:diguanylate cyclase (GGDEF)-like protein/PAS domain S-box-containing protein
MTGDVIAAARPNASDDDLSFRLAVESSAIGTCFVAADGTFRTVNPALCRMLARTPEDLLACTWRELTHPDDLGADTTLMADVVAGRRDDYRLRRRYLRPDGSVVWGDLSVGCVREGDGSVRYFIAQIVDLTEHVQDQERLAASEGRLKATLDSLLDPHVMLEAIRDERGTIVDFRYVDANDAACADSHLSKEEFVGSRLTDVFPGLSGSGLLVICAAAVESGEPLFLDDFSYPFDVHNGERRYDIRGIRVGDSLSYTWRDVTSRYLTARAIAESEERYRLLADSSSDVVLLARDGIMQWLSPSLRSTLGWSAAEWVGHGLEDFTHPEDVAVGKHRRVELSSGASSVTVLRVIGKDGNYHWADVHAGPFLDAGGEVRGIVASFRVIDDEMAAQQELERRARYDDLTGVVKRDEALARLHTLSRQVRRSGTESAVLFCDVDRFKRINDQHGHAAGDEVLRVLADRLRSCVRGDDTVARMGGDEFMVILDGVHGLDDAAVLAEKIRVTTGAPMSLPGGELSVTMSIGVTLCDPGEGVSSMMDRADQAMYEAKVHGRDQVTKVQRPGSSNGGGFDPSAGDAP